MKLITTDNYELKIADEALLIKPIRMLWNQDRSLRKEKFFQQISYLFFLVDPRSSYSYLLDEEERKRAIIEQEGLPQDFKPSQLLTEAMEIYRKHTVTVSQKLLNDALVAANTVGTFLRNVDLEESDKNGRPKYQVSQVTAALKNLEGIVSTIQALQKKVDQELEEKSKTRGAQELTIFDDVTD